MELATTPKVKKFGKQHEAKEIEIGDLVHFFLFFYMGVSTNGGTQVPQNGWFRN